jgi:hypothetical protein
VSHPRRLVSSASAYVIAFPLSVSYFSFTYILSKASILVTQFMYQVFWPAVFRVVMEWDEIAAMVLK